MPWRPVNLITPAVAQRILNDIDAGIDGGKQRYSNSPAAKGRAAWKVVVRHIPSFTEKRARTLIADWLKAGFIVEREYRDEIERKDREGLWDVAAQEWDLVGVYDDRYSDLRECPCTHSPIVEICELRNRVTGAHTEVGNVCVTRFLGLSSARIFSALRRISDNSGDITNSLNKDAIVFFRDRGVLTPWEYKFLTNTWRKRSLSERQLEQRIRINRKVLAAVSRRGLDLRPVNPFLPRPSHPTIDQLP